MSNIAFIDAQNVHRGTANQGWKINLKRFRKFLMDKYEISTAYYYFGAYKPDQVDLYNFVEKSGFELKFREHDDLAKSKKKGNVDTDIVFEMMKTAHLEDFEGKLYLISGDGDYFRTVEYLIEKDKFGKVLAPVKKNCSSLYKRRLSDHHYFFLDYPAVKKKIEYIKKTAI